MDIVSTINNSITIVSRLREITKNIENAEFKNLLADLSNDLADAKLEIAALKGRVAELTEENVKLCLQTGERKEKPTLKWGSYQFDDDKGLYCTACYDTKGLKVHTTRLNSSQRACPVCKAIFGA